MGPYPSPNASPRVRYDGLPPVPGIAGYEGEVALSGRLGMGVVGSHGFGSNQHQQQQQGNTGGGFGNEAGRAYDGELVGQGSGLGAGVVGIGGGGQAVVSKPHATTG